MSQQEQAQETLRSPSEVARRISQQTIPGSTNSDIITALQDAPEVVEAFVEDVNNWVEIVDVRVYDDGKIGIPCRYRWTVKRWASNDMDQWLMDHGWELLHHRKADSDEHRRNEMEARYRKEIEDYQVYANFYVEFTEDVFEALQEGKPIKMAEKERERNEMLEEVRQMKRGE